MLFRKAICKLSFIFLHLLFVNVQTQGTSTTSTASTTSIDTTTISIDTTTDSETIKEVFLYNDSVYSWTSKNYPQPYSAEDDYLIIKSEKGYYLSIIVESLDLDGSSGDFLLIKPGSALDDEKKGKVFTYHLNSERKYLLDSNDAYIGFYVFGNNENKNKGFSVKYQRVGEVISTTTGLPTTVITWPTPAGSDSIYYTGYVSGKPQDDFNDTIVLNDFKTALAGMAAEYCEINNILLSENITNTNVQIYYLIQCPNSWPDSNICIKVRFALPVVLAENSTWTGYQLTTPHLEQMWNRLANKYLNNYGLSVYSVPDNKSSANMWIVISLLVVLLFLVVSYFMNVVGHYFSPMRSMKRRSSDSSGIVNKEFRPSKISLEPHPYQQTPPFFDNDDSFHQFEPDLNITSRNYGQSFPLSEDDSDDNDIIFANSSHNQIPGSNRESTT